jgi:hypothetical protein
MVPTICASAKPKLSSCANTSSTAESASACSY